MKKNLLLILALVLGFAVSAQTPGTLVPNFADNGYLIYSVGATFDELHDVVVTPDGYIFSIGDTNVGDYAAFVARHDPNGVLDGSFGNNGAYRFDLTSQNYAAYGRGGHYYEDGSIVFGVHAYNWNNSDCDSYLIKLTANGTPDPSFGTNGVAKFNDGSSRTTLEDIQVLPDGRIVIIGYQLVGSRYLACVACFNADGTPDTSFGTNGACKPVFSSLYSESAGTYPKGSCVQSDGKIVLTGMADSANNSYTGFVARINPDGTVDETFGTSEPGLSLVDVGEDGHADFCLEPGMQTNGKIVVCGHTWKGQPPLTTYLEYAVFVTRLNADGSIDTSFARDGFIEVEYDEGRENYAEAMVVSATDDISVACYVWNTTTYSQDMFVLNLTSTGGLNFDYGDTGMFPFLDNGMQNTIADIALSHGNYGDIVVGGFTSYTDYTGFDIAIGKYYSAAVPTIPVIETSVQSLTGFYYAENDGPSDVNSYLLSGYNLENNVTVTASEYFEVSIDGQSFNDELVVDAANIPATIYVRMKAGLTENTYEGEIVNACEGAESVTVYLNGLVDEPEGIEENENMNVNVYFSNGIVIENNTENNVNVTVYNIAGQPVYTAVVGQGSQKLENIGTGAYIVKMNVNGTESMKKVIVR